MVPKQPGEKLWSHAEYTFHLSTAVCCCTWVIKQIQHTERNSCCELQWEGFVASVRFQMIKSFCRDYICTLIVCGGWCLYGLKATVWGRGERDADELPCSNTTSALWGTRWSRADEISVKRRPTLCSYGFWSSVETCLAEEENDVGFVERSRTERETDWVKGRWGQGQVVSWHARGQTGDMDGISFPLTLPHNVSDSIYTAHAHTHTHTHVTDEHMMTGRQTHSEYMSDTHTTHTHVPSIRSEPSCDQLQLTSSH